MPALVGYVVVWHPYPAQLLSFVVLILPLSHNSGRLWAIFCLGGTALTMILWLGFVERYSADEADAKIKLEKRSSISILKSGQNIPHFGHF